MSSTAASPTAAAAASAASPPPTSVLSPPSAGKRGKSPSRSPPSILPPAIFIPSRSPASSSAAAHVHAQATSLQQLYPAPTPPLPETPSCSRSPLGPARDATLPGSSSLSPLPFPTVGPADKAPSTAQTASALAASASSSSSTPPSASPKTAWRRKLVLVLVGLPARGKSYIAYKLLGYLRWRGLNASLFNVGKHRRQVADNSSADFFSADNKEAKAARDNIAMEVLECMLDWLQSGGDVSIFDATNTTAARRRDVLSKCVARSSELKVIFLESICDDARVLENNYRVKVQNSPDYKNVPLEDALKDLRMRVANYEKIYESIDDDELSYIKLHNLASKVICNRIHGQLAHAIVAYISSIHVQPRPIYFVRAGHSESKRGEIEQQFADRQILKLPDASGGVGASSSPKPSMDAALTDFHIPYTVAMAANLDSRGVAFASRLSDFISHKVDEYTRIKDHAEREVARALSHQKHQTAPSAASAASAPSSHTLAVPTSSPPPSVPVPPMIRDGSFSADHIPIVVYTSTLPRSIQTVSDFKEKAYIFEPQSSLNMIDTGVCSGMSIEEIREKMPQELEKWQKHKYKYRFPGGESQADRAKSLEPLVFELERQTLPVLVVSHMSTLQVLLGFFYGSKRSVDSYYSLWIPQHVVLELIPHQYGWLEIRHDLSEEACAADDVDSAAAESSGSASPHLPRSPARSPSQANKHHPVPVELGTAEKEEIERFNLQPLGESRIAPPPHTRGSISKPAPSGISLLTFDRSISVSLPPNAVSGIASSSTPSPSSALLAAANPKPSPPPATESLPPAFDFQRRQGSIGRSTQVKILGDTNFYESEGGQ